MQGRQVADIAGIEDCLLGCPRLFERQFRCLRDEGADGVTEPLTALEVVLSEFDRRQLSTANGVSLLQRCEVVECGHARDSSASPSCLLRASPSHSGPKTRNSTAK